MSPPSKHEELNDETVLLRQNEPVAEYDPAKWPCGESGPEYDFFCIPEVSYLPPKTEK